MEIYQATIEDLEGVADLSRLTGTKTPTSTQQ